MVEVAFPAELGQGGRQGLDRARPAGVKRAEPVELRYERPMAVLSPVGRESPVGGEQRGAVPPQPFGGGEVAAHRGQPARGVQGVEAVGLLTLGLIEEGGQPALALGEPPVGDPVAAQRTGQLQPGVAVLRGGAVAERQVEVRVLLAQPAQPPRPARRRGRRPEAPAPPLRVAGRCQRFFALVPAGQE
ncbi:hypothetical protein I6A84_41140 [Frankia sp. CNm7]|uniref:Uncharacterized protein n=1 Tax=Frankia nepalensis TaxID=1836974 RepID=A0A937UQS8_9ACTN|nr:hypothetical protein [Frankia nepalensis]MBL7502044.1 hypothetical protein [Frankia nepalensis]MBL7511950.1 hypothetical protein [Frankia nepalensis]MBL7524277.1 hypothetical protein [Frankia nepalensis]MBL7630542.1 hypothetical protein [Frankia nepalensis]